MSGEPATPTLTQRVRYIAGATLPPSMHQRVIDDLTGPGAARRTALMYVYRRHRLAKHGLDPALADARERQKHAAEREAYERRHGR